MLLPITPPAFIVTGGLRAQQAAKMIDLKRFNLYGEIGALSDDFTAGGPLDAPEYLPAGAMNNTEWRRGDGLPLACQFEVRRP